MSAISEAIAASCQRYLISPNLLSALIIGESSGNIFARRYEPAFYNRYVAGLGRTDLLGFVPEDVGLRQEQQDRATSWGLCQIMGNTAREMGFQGKHLGRELCLPSTNIEYGARLLHKFLVEKKQNVNDALLRYNGGSNPQYPKYILGFVGTDKALALLRK